jgi:hypothetical protein
MVATTAAAAPVAVVVQDFVFDPQEAVFWMHVVLLGVFHVQQELKLEPRVFRVNSTPT